MEPHLGTHGHPCRITVRNLFAGLQNAFKLAACSSRFTRGRAEVSIDRGLWGAARSHLSWFKNVFPFVCSKTHYPTPHAQRRRILPRPAVLFSLELVL
ncbi:hypothetical protein EVAR_10914_1 [Eumeta japonica]|uniref:Uncharacterized protein n=1 Tax=Eumeta variegata TaxID=151549 RepID=A0A4C1U6L8_EUMVA|nr:hypothetical protein EVAR_10914_1 [Eumeta japonica]